MEYPNLNLNENSSLSSIIIEIRNNLLNVQSQIKDFTNLPQLRNDWASKADVMKFLGLKESRLLELTKEYNLITSFFGKKKFYYIKSIQQVLNKNKQAFN